MVLIIKLPAYLSSNDILENIIANIKACHHPNWRYDTNIDDKDVIFHNPYQFYTDKSIIFLPYLKDNSIVFESSHWSETPSPGVEQEKNHIIRLCAFLLKEYFEEGVSIQIL